MISFLFAMTLAIHLGPIAPDVPAREPQLAVNGSTIALAFGGGKGIYFSASKDGGKSFSAPVKVAEAEIVPLTRHRGPRIAFSRGAIVITAVAGKTVAAGEHAHGLPSDGDLLAWRSEDGGKTWSRAVVINDVPGAPTEGLHTLASDPHGNLFSAWLDKRGGNGTRLFGSRSTDGGASWSRNVMIYQSPEGTICECCHPTVAMDAAGQVLVMWRNWLAGSRDMYLTRSRDGVSFSKPEKLGAGTWPLNACPMDGGGLVVSDSKVVTAWRRGENVFLDEPGKPETQIGTGKDIALALAGDRSSVIWTNSGAIEYWTGGRTQILSKAGAFPTLTALPNGGLMAAWEENGGLQIQVLPAVPTKGRP
jgi:hypothetical protein